MKKYVILTLLLICSLILYTNIVCAYSVDSNNNPGTDSSQGSGTAGSGTNWAGSLRVVRIRIFRGNTSIASSYYLLEDKADTCAGSTKVSSVTAKLCETSGYDYASVKNDNGVSCGSKQTTNLGCIGSSGLKSSWSHEAANGNTLNNYLINNEYTNLKNILAGMGYNDSTFSNDDVVIVEPATQVKCAGTLYFGTSTALMSANVSYRGSSGNKCSANDNDYRKEGATSPVIGYTFQNLFNNMSTALKVSSTRKFDDKDNVYSGFGYFRYNVSGMGYVDPDGDLRVEIYVDGTNPKQLITSEALTFNIRSGHGCTGNIVERGLSTGHSGFATRTLATGDYSIEMTGHPSTNNYQRKSGVDYTCRNITLTSAGETVSVPYEKGCNVEKNENSSDGYTMTDAIRLYDKYGYNGLLNTSNPSCSSVSCDTQNASVGCLTANLQTNISSTNLVCADITRDSSGKAVVFCDDTFSLSNNLIFNGAPVTTFYGTSGEFLIKKDTETNLYRIYKAGNFPEYISAQNGIATAVSQKICYILKGSTFSATYNPAVSNVDSYLDDKRLVSNEISGQSNALISDGIFDVYTYEKTYNFDLNTVYLEKITGEVATSPSTNTTSIIGLLSKFKSENGDILFSVDHNGEKYTTSSNNSCKYILEPNIITFEKDEDGKLNLEFRIIDTARPFVDRNTNSNWCSGSDCDKDNNLVTNEIKNSNNSYNKTGEGPKYKIILTPSDIKLVRMYNNDNKYDDYITYCDSNNICQNAFIYDLSTGTLNKYENNRVIETYGALQSKLIIREDS